MPHRVQCGFRFKETNPEVLTQASTREHNDMMLLGPMQALKAMLVTVT